MKKWLKYGISGFLIILIIIFISDLFYVETPPTSSSLGLELAFVDACVEYRNDGCPPGISVLNSSKYAQDVNGKILTLLQICRYKGIAALEDLQGEIDCSYACGCPE